MPDKIKTRIGTRNSLTVSGRVPILGATGPTGWLSGESTYDSLPKDVPANMFWTLTAYDNET